MQASPYCTHCAPCAHDLARHEPGSAIIGDFTNFNIPEYIKQIMAQVRTVLLPELNKIEEAVHECNEKITTVAERMKILESKLEVYELGKRLEEKLEKRIETLVPQGPT